MITPLGWLERVPTYKERLRDMAERDVANFGLLGYPLLQTVDIVIVHGEVVPVGEDQVSHLELSREIVRRFNRLYGEVLVEPQPLLSETPLIPGSDGRKMSKSLDNTIELSADPDTIRARVRSFSPDDVARVEATCRTGELGCVDCKSLLADHLIERFEGFRERRAELGRTPGLAKDVLAAGIERVRPIATQTLEAVRAAMRFEG